MAGAGGAIRRRLLHFEDALSRCGFFSVSNIMKKNSRLGAALQGVFASVDSTIAGLKAMSKSTQVGGRKKSMNMKLLKVKGQLRLYERKPGEAMRYVVVHADGRVLEEFFGKTRAGQWMSAQKESKVPAVLRDGEICDDCRLILEKDDAGMSCPDGSHVCQSCFDKGNH